MTVIISVDMFFPGVGRLFKVSLRMALSRLGFDTLL